MDLRTLESTPPWDWPEDTGQVLLQILVDDNTDEAERSLAADLAGDFVVIDDDLAAALLSLAGRSDLPEMIRCEAALSLATVLEHTFMMGFEDADDILISERMYNRIRETLRALYADSTVPLEVRRRILEASAHAPQAWHRDAVRSAYAADDESWRLTAVFCMRFVPGFDDQILAELDNPDSLVQFHAVCAAGTWEIERAWPQVAALLTADDIDKDLLSATIVTAALIRPREAAELIQPFLESEDEDIIDAVMEATTIAGGLVELEDDQ